MLSRSATVARTDPATESWAMTPTCRAFGENQMSTSVRSLAGRLSAGWYSENPPRRVAFAHTGSSSRPSMTASASMRGTVNDGEPLPSTTAGGAASCAGARGG